MENQGVIWSNWAILVLIGVLESGLSSFILSATIIYQFFLTQYGGTPSDTASANSIANFARQVACLFAAYFINRFGVRKVAIGCGILLVISCIITAVAPNLWVVYISYGLMKGFGFYTYMLTRQTVIQKAFVESRAKAIALQNSVCWGLGGLYGPMVITTIYHQYSFFGAFLLLAGLVLHLIPNGMLLSILIPQKQDDGYTTNIKGEGKNRIGSKNEGTEFIELEQTEQNRAEQKVDPRQDGYIENECVEATGSRTSSFRRETKIITGRSVVYRMALKISKLLGFSLLRNKNLALFCVLAIIFGSHHQCVDVLFSGLLYEKGYSESNLVFIVSSSYVLQIGVRIVIGIIMDLKVVKPHRMVLYVCLHVSAGLFAILIPIISGLIPTIMCFIIMSGSVNIAYTQIGTVLADMVQPQEIANILGLCLFFLGIGSIVGPIVGAALIDWTGTYTTCFYLSGTMMTTSALSYLVIFILYFKNRQSRSLST